MILRKGQTVIIRIHETSPEMTAIVESVSEITVTVSLIVKLIEDLKGNTCWKKDDKVMLSPYMVKRIVKTK